MNINRYRKDIGITQEELAAEMGIKQYVVAKYERGVHSPTPDRISETAKILGVGIAALYGEQKAPKIFPKQTSRKTRIGQLSAVFETSLHRNKEQCLAMQGIC